MTNLAQVRRSAGVIDGAAAAGDLMLDADVCIVGSGAGGAVTAGVLSAAGRSVLLVEEGGYFDTSDFTMHERDVAPKLYQEGMQRATKDLAIAVLQGRAVGGTTVVNWTTSFRTPEHVVAHWAKHHQVGGFQSGDLTPHFDAIEARLSIHKVDEAAMNKNNRKLYDGCKAKGWKVETTSRNVYSCLQTGSCGMGCPVNAKRSMLVTLIPDAIDAGARVLYHCRVDRLEVSAGEVRAAHCTLLDAEGRLPTGKRATLRAKRFILSGGAINTPAVLLRSGLDGGGLVGSRTFLHPAIVSLATYPEPIEAYYGAPQSAASHEFARREGKVGFFLETAPTHPMLTAQAMPGFGADHRKRMEGLAHLAVHVALAIDGFQEDVPGGKVELRPSGAPVLDYPVAPAVWESFAVGQQRLAELAFASGATSVATLHEPPITLTSPADVASLEQAPWAPSRVAVITAHQMGGCRMGDDPRTSVVRSEDLRHHQLANLHVIDGSVFPTSLGVNPQESIYGLARLMATRIAANG